MSAYLLLAHLLLAYLLLAIDHHDATRLQSMFFFKCKKCEYFQLYV